MFKGHKELLFVLVLLNYLMQHNNFLNIVRNIPLSMFFVFLIKCMIISVERVANKEMTYLISRSSIII